MQDPLAHLVPCCSQGLAQPTLPLAMSFLSPWRGCPNPSGLVQICLSKKAFPVCPAGLSSKLLGQSLPLSARVLVKCHSFIHSADMSAQACAKYEATEADISTHLICILGHELSRGSGRIFLGLRMWSWFWGKRGRMATELPLTR